MGSTNVRTLLPALLFLVAASPAAAQTRTNSLWRMGDHDAVALTSTFTRDAQGAHMQIELARVPAPAAMPAVAHGRADGAPRRIYEGDPVASTLVATPNGAAVIAWEPTKLVVYVARLDVAATDADALKTIELPRPAGEASRVFAAVGALKDGELLVLWNEVGPSSGSAARSYFARVALAGTIATAPREVQVPWSIAGLVPVADGFELAVRYDGQGPDQTRLCLVHLTPELVPTEHPWWATRPAMVGDVQLLDANGTVRVVYATPGGIMASADRRTGQWGQEAPASARLAAPSSFAATLRAHGELGVVTP